MDKHKCGTRACLNKIKFYNSNEDSYYCRKCAIYLFKEGECRKIGCLATLKELLDLNKSVLDGIYEYVIDEHLEIKWSLAFEQHKIFNEELKRINRELGEVLSTNKLKDIARIQQYASDLKLKITESEIFSKYLMHKEMNKHRERGKLKESKHFINDLANDYDKMKTEEEKIAILEKFKNIKNFLNFEHTDNLELEEFKRKHLEDIDELKKKQEKYIEIYEKEKNDLIAKNTKLEQELNRIKTMQKENEENMQDSYDAIKEIYKQIKGEEININSKSDLSLFLCNEKDRNILKALSKLKLRKLNGVTLSFIPNECEELKKFMENSIQNLNEFHFNDDDDINSNLESSYYLSSLVEIASKTENQISVDCISFSQKDFEKFIYFSKHICEVSLRNDQLQLEEECNFGENMKGCKIKYLDLSCSGNEMNSNWKIKPHRFENLIKGIANCNPFHESLKTISIKGCEFSKDEAQLILNKYSLDNVDILS